MNWDDVEIVIRSVPGAREAMVADLAARVRRFAPVSVSYHHPGRSVPESYADALAWPTSRRWVLQLEDDAILAPDFEEHAPRMFFEIDDDQRVGLLSFYSGRRIADGESLPPEPMVERLPGARFLMAQAIAMRAEHVADHNAFMLNFTRVRPYATDTATAAWLKIRKLRFARAWPSIVQHRDVPSLSGHRPNSNRRSSSYEAIYGAA